MTLDFLPPQAYTKETLLKAYNWLQSQSDQVREMATTPDQLVSLFLKASRHGQETLERPSLQNFKSELKNLAAMMPDLEKKQQAVTAQVVTQPVTVTHIPPSAPQNFQGAAQVSQTTTTQSFATNTITTQQVGVAQTSAPIPPPPQAAFVNPTSAQPTYANPTSSQSTYVNPSVQQHGYNNQPTHQTTYSQPTPPPTGHGSYSQSTPHQGQPEHVYQTTHAAPSRGSNIDEATQSLIREVKNELNLSSDHEALRMLVKIGYQKVRSLYK